MNNWLRPTPLTLSHYEVVWPVDSHPHGTTHHSVVYGVLHMLCGRGRCKSSVKGEGRDREVERDEVLAN